MAHPSRDISGQVFGRLTAIERDGNLGHHTAWRFACSCGNEKRIGMAGVVGGRVRSCGCLHMERCRTGLNRLRHGDAKVGQVTRLHKIWRKMLDRCNRHPDYAGRGIAVCEAWQDYAAFKAWAEAHGYAAELSIERLDNDKGYSPDNCSWEGAKAQARNRRTSRHITIDGRTQVLVAWLDETGVSNSAFQGRIRRGWSEQRALFPNR